VNWDVSDSATLTSITDFQSLERDYIEDTDGTSFRIFNFFSFMDSEQFSQELRLEGQSQVTNWVLGAYYLEIDHDIRTGIDAVPDDNTLNNANPGVLFPFLTDNRNRQQTESWAVFAQGEYSLSDRWTLIGGLRWSEDDKSIDIDSSCGGDIFGFVCDIIADPSVVQGSGFDGAQSDGDYSAKLQLDFRPNDDLLIYGGITRGQKGGGFNAAAIAGITPDLVPYSPEILTNFEIGFKSELADGKARLNGSVFYYDYEDYQAFTLTGLTPTVFNTDATVNGFELELHATPIDGLNIVLGAAYLDTAAENVPNNLLPGSVNLGDQAMPQSPEWTYNGLARYEWPALGGHLAIQGDVNFVDERAFNTVNHPALIGDSYTIANARITYTSSDDRWNMAIWIKNLTEEEYTSFAFDFSGSDGTTPGYINSPRWAGITASFNF
jgi:iron complex outermembrane receptor protein